MKFYFNSNAGLTHTHLSAALLSLLAVSPVVLLQLPVGLRIKKKEKRGRGDILN